MTIRSRTVPEKYLDSAVADIKASKGTILNIDSTQGDRKRIVYEQGKSPFEERIGQMGAVKAYRVYSSAYERILGLFGVKTNKVIPVIDLSFIPWSDTRDILKWEVEGIISACTIKERWSRKNQELLLVTGPIKAFVLVDTSNKITTTH